MNYIRFFLCVKACLVAGVKVNMQGSLTLGKDVINGLSYYIGKNVMNGRRSLIPTPIEDPATLAVRNALVCKDLEFCEGLQHFVNEYIIVLAKATESILNSSQIDFHPVTYDEQLQHSLEYIRKVLEDASTKIENNKDVYYWIHSIKQINAKFQEMIQVFIPDDMESKETVKNKMKTELRHKITIITTFIERKYAIKLCSEHDICSKSNECTIALDKILIHFKTLPEDKIRLFIKYVFENLFDTTFYSHLKQTTAHNFQVILNDMVYSNDTPTKDLMLSVQKTVEARMEIIRTNKGSEVAHDVLIAHAILSDLDHMYSDRTEPFTMFLNRFYDWLASDIQINKVIRQIMFEISKEIWSHDVYLVTKLINEVKVFLEMTVGPEK